MKRLAWLDNYLETGVLAVELKNSEGWLSRDGRFFPCGYAEHSIMAVEIIKQEWPVEGRIASYQADDFLVQRGWHRVGIDGLINSGFPKGFSQDQIDTLEKLARKSRPYKRQVMEEFITTAKEWYLKES